MMAQPTFDVIGLGPAADGWRAMFSSDSGWQIAPLVCWGAFVKKTPGQPDETLISGVVTNSSPGGPVRFLVPAAGGTNFEGYLEPGQPTPP
jgi:hypothetical protein